MADDQMSLDYWRGMVQSRDAEIARLTAELAEKTRLWDETWVALSETTLAHGQALQELDAMRAERVTRPIESAPSNRAVLVFDSEGDCGRGVWTGAVMLYGTWLSESGFTMCAESLSYWMPMPAAPSKGNAKCLT